MLSIGKIALGQHRYYEQQVAAGGDDYYSGRGEAPGRWVGAGAEALGLSGSVSADQFNALIAGLDPRDPDERLRSSTVDPKVAAFDLTFSAPKSLSVLFAIAPEAVSRQLAECHEEAVAGALDYLEDAAVQVRRGHGGERVEPAQGLIAAAYRHRMSRALDPQLHTHIVGANLARGPDGRYTALHGTALYRAAKTAGFLYQAHVRALVVERLGLEWGEVHKGAAELVSVARPVLEHFSTRRAEMLRAAAEGGIGLGTKAAAEHAAIATRDRKQYGVETHTWREEVRVRAGELGLGGAEVSELFSDGRRVVLHDGVPGGSADERMLGDRLSSAGGLTERSNTFDQREVLQEFANAAGQGALVVEVRGQAERFAGRDDVIPCEGGEMTTAELVSCERQLIAAAIGRAGEGTASVDVGHVERVIGESDRCLTAEQAAAVREVVANGDGVSVIQALAGTGKTYTAGVLREVYERAGYEVLGAAPTGRAARELAEEAGVAARTLDRLLGDCERLGEQLARECVVILDEAGMAATRPTARLLQAAERAGAKVVAIGDPGQLASVQAGGWLGGVGRALGVSRITEVVRQRDQHERRALSALHSGQPLRYLGWAERAGRIDIADDPVRIQEQALSEWARASDTVGPAQAVMIARDNDTRDSLNQGARVLRRTLGELGDERSYGTVELAVGDRLICRRNDRLIDVDNGMRGTVRHLDADRVVVDTDSGLARELPSGYVAEHVEHAYALTAHGMQGATVEAAFVLAAPRDLTAGWSYTALSRARGQTRLLLYERDPAEREEYAPAGRGGSVGRELLDRAGRRMCERDDEELALERLSARGCGESPQIAAREAQRIADIDNRVVALRAQREQLTRAAVHTDEPRRRFAKRHDTDVELAHVSSALAANDCALEALLAEREELAARVGPREETRAERADLGSAHGVEREASAAAFGAPGELELPVREWRSAPDRDLDIDL